MSDAVAVTLASRLDEIQRMAAVIEQFGAAHNLTADIVFALNLSLDEVITNVISYAFADGGEHRIEVRLRLADGTLRAEIEDDGRDFNPLDVPPPDLSAPIEQRPVGGLGLHIVRSMMDAVEYRRDGGHNVLTLTKRVEPPAG